MAVFPNFKTIASCTYWQGKSLENIIRMHFLEILDFLSNLWTTIWKRVLCLLISLDLNHYLVLHRYIMCNPQDLGCDCVNPHDTRYYPERLLVYDRHPGGIGISVQVWPWLWLELLLFHLSFCMFLIFNPLFTILLGSTFLHKTKIVW